MNKPKRNNIWAVVAGFLSVAALSVATDYILEAAGIFPQQGLFAGRLLALALAYRIVYTVVGGYVTAALASERPLRYVNILGIIGTVAGIAGVFAGWNLSAHWYPIAIALTAFPATWLGGKLAASRTGGK